MYSRQELCQAIMDACGPELVPDFYDQSADTTASIDIDNDNDNDNDNKNNNNNEKETMVDADDADAKSGGCEGSGKWSVNLEEFDIELVIVILPPDLRSSKNNGGTGNGTLAFGISLCPHSFLKSKSFASGHIPPDVTMPYLGGDILSQNIVRLRPTNAHLLLEMADLQTYDIVLDPCAGIGTIPIEA